MAFHGWSGAWLDPSFRASFDLSAELTRIRVPILILQGTADPYGTAAQARMAERAAPGLVRTVMLEAGHAPHTEAAQATIDAIADFASRRFPAGANIA